MPMNLPPNSMKRLFIISNRLPIQLVRQESTVQLLESAGGLATALKSYLQAQDRSSFEPEEVVWVGNADFSRELWEEFQQSKRSTGTFKIEPLWLDDDVNDGFYNGLSNSTIWPLFHYFPSFAEFKEPNWQAYQQANTVFADRLAELYQPDDVLWVQDYHLMLLPALLRERCPEATIGFFLHIPFPSFEVYRMLPNRWREGLLQGMLGADLIGFHTNDYVQHFEKSVQRLLGIESKLRFVQIPNRPVRVDLFPISIDYDRFNSSYRLPGVVAEREAIHQQLQGNKLLFSVDRLDYTKGVLNRLQGYEKFLENHPEWHGKINFVMVVVPSRSEITSYGERKQMIEENIGRINGRFATVSWQPLVYQYRSLSFEQLCAYYTACDVALITPIRDGMNLVAKEFIASRQDEQGVLILSEVAGAAAELGEALLINPTDRVGMALAIEEALSMPVKTQAERIKRMQTRIRDYDVVQWADDFLTQLFNAKAQQNQWEVRLLNVALRKELMDNYQKAQKRLLLLDYDGTLVPFAKFPDLARPSERVIELLSELANVPQNRIVIISGRDKKTLENWFGSLSIQLVAEHGAAVRLPDGNWQENPEAFLPEWRSNIQQAMNLAVQRCPGTFVEEKTHSLAWHYRNTGADLGFAQSRELIDTLHGLTGHQLQVIDGNKVVEVRVTGVDKGSVASRLASDDQYDFILAIGDDRTDEDMFRTLADRAITIKVGQQKTLARYSLPDTGAVLSFLQRFTSMDTPPNVELTPNPHLASA
ncbi:bifunctional alpha,alpha-trehalose-phosphate synthase (UDP-forming)/trehalose-phosphatase [Siphonobacter sp. BAB-5405]|nr:bifunctional alpha,alpha-trehalose-phosphate synthase (UDP-forming)/trehalose-phosphatase [Siphonobacter sp. BAB-5405]